MDILKTLEQLHEVAVTEPRFVLGLTFGYDRDEVTMLISKVRASLPDELKAAATTLREKDRILSAAQQDAESTLQRAQEEALQIVQEANARAAQTLEQARREQAQLVSEHEVLKLTKAQCDEIRSDSDRYALQMRRDADKYAHDILSRLENTVGKAMQVIDRDKAELARDLGTSDNAIVNSIARPKQKV